MNWLDLGIGVGLGFVSGWLFQRPKQLISSTGQQEQDLTAVLEELKQTQLAYQMAQEMSQFKGGFLARTSHELRSPLNSLIGLHQLILADLCDDPAEERQFIAQANEAALNLVKLLDEILDVARVEHGKAYLQIQPLQLACVLQEVYQITYMLAANRNFKLELSPPEAEIYVLADPLRLRQVLISLIDVCILQLENSTIFISTEAKAAEQLVYIWLDVELPLSTWSEPVDFISKSACSIPVNEDDVLVSHGMTLLLNQIVLELMKGSLKFLPVINNGNQSDSTRIEITIPLMIPETGLSEQQAN